MSSDYLFDDFCLGINIDYQIKESYFLFFLFSIGNNGVGRKIC